MKTKTHILAALLLAAMGCAVQAADTTLLSDDFNDGTLDPAKWTIIKATGSGSGFDESSAGNSLTESGGSMNITQAASDAGGAYKTALLSVNDLGQIVVERRTKVHYAATNVTMAEGLVTEAGGGLLSWGYFNYSSGSLYGFGGRYDTRVAGVWDAWFDETITYDPTTGQGSYSLNGEAPVAITGAVMPAGTTNVYLRGGAYGWNTSHTKQFDSFQVSQAGLASNEVILAVQSDQGAPVPALGNSVHIIGSSVTCSVANVVAADTQHLCTGWTGIGSVPASGTATSVVFTITEESSITWNWQTEYWLEAETNGQGQVDGGNTWFAEGSTATLVATPDAGWYFAGWSGDATGIGDAAVTMDSPKSVMAEFILQTGITNITVQQIEGSRNVQVSYNLAGTNQMIVGLAIYKNGTNINASSFSGDIGMIDVGTNKVITWNAAADWNLNAADLTFVLESEDGLPLYRPYEPGLWAIPKTHITTDYYSTTDGEDGDVQAGMEWPSPRFTDNGDGTVTDNMTGLQWGKTASYTSWYSSMSACENLSLGGHDDWRLPNVRELRSIFSDFSRQSPVVEPGMFSISSSTYFWTSTRWEYSMGYGYAISSGFGYTVPRSLGTTYGYLPVRSSSTGPVEIPKTGQSSSWDASRTTEDGDLQLGQAWPTPRFTDHGDGTATDNLTGLMWHTAYIGRYSWASALTTCNNLTTGGHGDWRLPNINELETLVDYGEKYPAPTLPAGHPFTGFPIGTTTYTWSSSTPSGTGYGYVINFYDGHIDAVSKGTGYYVMACRGGTEYLQDFGYPASAVAALTQTGQTNSYHVADDGDLQTGTEEPTPRWTENPSLLQVTDNQTGLTWLKMPPTQTKYSWFSAMSYAESYSYGGYSDWRMPNIRELESLVAYGQTVPALPDGHLFQNITNEYYWSSTTFFPDSNRAHALYMGYGRRTSINKSDAGAALMILVRGSSGVVPKTGQTYSFVTGDDGYYAGGNWGAAVADRFADHGNGLVSDKLTGLAWFKDPSIVAPDKMHWADALDTCGAINYAGFNDWRMPNQKELESLIDWGRWNAALPPGHPFENIHASYGIGDYYWSSTTYAHSTDRAQAIEFATGDLKQPIKTNADSYVWPVRGGN